MRKYFGTDGIRDIANLNLTPEFAYKVAKSGASVLAKTTGRIPTILIGMDTRISSEYNKSENLLGDLNDNEKHYITSKGRVFVLPGYKVVRENGDVFYYVNDKDSYKK